MVSEGDDEMEPRSQVCPMPEARREFVTPYKKALFFEKKKPKTFGF
jgi:hypothetical protein